MSLDVHVFSRVPSTAILVPPGLGRFAAIRQGEMSQFDFAFLAVQFVSSEAEANCISMGKPSSALESAGKIENCLMEVDAPEQYDDVGPTESSISQNVLELTRFLQCNAPPLRFHRTRFRHSNAPPRRFHRMEIHGYSDSRHVKYVDEKGGPLKQRPIQELRGPCTWNAAN